MEGFFFLFLKVIYICAFIFSFFFQTWNCLRYGNVVVVVLPLLILILLILI